MIWWEVDLLGVDLVGVDFVRVDFVGLTRTAIMLGLKKKKNFTSCVASTIVQV